MAMQQRIALERILRDAVDNERFEVHYQPLFEMNGNRLIGFRGAGAAASFGRYR